VFLFNGVDLVGIGLAKRLWKLKINSCVSKSLISGLQDSLHASEIP
jgi:hypothetical protein